MRTNVSGESPAQISGKTRHMGNFGRRELMPDEIIRVVKERFRICRYIFNVGGFWFLGAGVLGFFIKAIGLDTAKDDLPTLLFVLIMIGAAINVCGFALTLALYRCPVCDHYLSRFRPDKLRCPGCGAQVKESE